MRNKLEQALTILVEGLKAGGPYSHAATNEYERRFFLQELLAEVRRHQSQPDIPESESGSIVPDLGSSILHQRSGRQR